MYKLYLYGTFQIVDQYAQDCTPRSVKTKGLIALLALAPRQRQSRRWLESKLWSSSPATHAAASLRQSLMELRRMTGNHLIATDRQDIWLIADNVQLEPKDPEKAEEQLLQGLDINDPEFNEWLRFQQTYSERQFTESKLDETTSKPSPAENFPLQKAPENLLQCIFNSQVSQYLIERGVEIIKTSEDNLLVSTKKNTLILYTQTIGKYNNTGLYIELRNLEKRKLYWSKVFSPKETVGSNTHSLLENTSIVSLSIQSAERLLHLLIKNLPTNHTLQAMTLIQMGVALINRFNLPDLYTADQLFAKAQELSEHPIIPAWRCFLRSAIHIEHPDTNAALIKEEASLLLDTAIVTGGDNALVLSIASQVKQYLFKDISAACQLSAVAVRANPHDPMVLDGAALCASARGDESTAAEYVFRASNIGGNSQMRHWWEMSRALVLARTHDYEGAAEAAEAALVTAPGFRPPLRWLYTLYLQLDELQSARQRLDQIRKYEPDFSLEMVRATPEYPMPLLRETPLIALSDLPNIDF